MKAAKTLILIAATVFSPCWSHAQRLDAEKSERRLIDRDKRPDLAADYSQVAGFKLATRKSVYHLGEMITLEAAMLNTSGRPIFFDRLDPQFFLYDEQGVEVKIQPYGIVCRALSPNSFELIEPNYMAADSSEFLIGCDDKVFERFDGVAEDKDEKRLYENNLFVGYGSACLRINIPGTYTIKARQQSRHLIESLKEPGVKTAVGVIETAPLEIKVVE